MKTDIKVDVTDRTVLVFIPDPASTVGKGKTGLVAANLTVSYTRVETDNDVAVTDVTGALNDLAALTTAHTDWGLKEVSATLAPGLYRLDLADAVFASGAWFAVVYVMITSGLASASPMEFVLRTEDLDDIAAFIDTEIAAILAAVDTEIGNIQSRLPAALTADGNMKVDVLRINGTQLLGDGDATPWGPV